MGQASPTMTFSGHETFPFRYPWLKKGVDAVAEDGAVFHRDEAVTILGVGKNMVRSIRHWCLAAGVVEDVATESRQPSHYLRPSRFGKALFLDDGWDPYLEDPATLWLLHWRIVSNRRRCPTWHWAFNCVHEPEFNKELLVSGLQSWAQNVGVKRLALSSLRRDVDCFLRT